MKRSSVQFGGPVPYPGRCGTSQGCPTFITGSGGDYGVRTFPGGVTLITVGDQTLTAKDTGSGRTVRVTITVGAGP